MVRGRWCVCSLWFALFIATALSETAMDDGRAGDEDLTVAISALTLMTRDIEASAAFYDALGFRLTYAGDDPPWRTFAIGRRDALNLQAS